MVEKRENGLVDEMDMRSALEFMAKVRGAGHSDLSDVIENRLDQIINGVEAIDLKSEKVTVDLGDVRQEFIRRTSRLSDSEGLGPMSWGS